MKNLTKWEVAERTKYWWDQWQEAEKRLLEPLLERMLVIARTHMWK